MTALSRSAVVLVSAVIGLIVGGLAIHGWTLSRPPPGVDASDFAFSFGLYVRPEPEERATYLGLLILTPFLLGGLAFLARRRLPAARARNGVLLVLAAAVLAASFPRDPLHRAMVGAVLELPLTTALLIGLAASALVCWSARSTGRHGLRASWVTFGLLLVLSTLATLSWRIYGAGSIDDGRTENFDAFAYSPAQIALGSVCLADVIPQYGCYGEFLRPVLAILGPKVSVVTSAMAVLETVSVAAILLFARSLIRDTSALLGAGLWIIIVTNQILWGGNYTYPQYWPLRLLFPTLSLLLVMTWAGRESIPRALAYGCFAGLALWWNLDTGAVVIVALGAFILLSGATAHPVRSPGRWGDRIALAGAYAGGVGAAILAFYAYLCLRAGGPVDQSLYTVFQRLFFVTGFFMLPMPGFPDPWYGAIILALLALTWYALRFGGVRSGGRTERAAYLALLALGLFSYFVGRSHPVVLIAVSWPFVLLAFHAVDQSGLGRRGVGAVLPHALVAAAITVALSLIVRGLPTVVEVSSSNWARLGSASPPSPLQQHASFIRSELGGRREAVILSRFQAQLVGETGIRSPLTGPGLGETIRRSDADGIVNQVAAGDVADIFVELPFLDSRLWSPRLEGRFELAAWSRDQNLAHLRRREREISPPPRGWTGETQAWTSPAGCGPLRFEARETPEGTLLDMRGRRFALPFDLPQAGAAYAVDVVLRLAPAQKAYAALLSNHAGWRGFVIHHPPGTAADSFVVVVGDGATWREGPTLALPSDRDFTLRAEVAGDRLTLRVDGQVVADGLGPMAEPIVPLTVGNWNSPGRELAADVRQVRLYDCAQDGQPR